MTAWHDQPPQTRRQVRLSERGGAAHGPNSGAPARDDTSAFTTAPRSTVGEQTDPAEAAQQAADAAVRRAASGSRGERFSASPARHEPHGASDAASASRPDAPLSRRAAREAAARVAANDAASDAASTDAQPAAAPVFELPVFEAPAFEVPVFEAPAFEEPVVEAAAEPTADAGRPLTRRELRGREQRQQQAASTPASPAAPAAPAAPAEAPQSAAPHYAAPKFAEPSVLGNPPPLVEPELDEGASAPFDLSALNATVDELSSSTETPRATHPTFDVPVFVTPEAPSFEPPAMPTAAAPVYDPSIFAAPAFEVPVFEAPVSEAPVTEVPDFETAAVEAPVFDDDAIEIPVAEAPAAEPSTQFADEPSAAPAYSRPTGHWSTQEALDDASQASAVTSRDLSVATGPVTSSVLVMPAGLHSGNLTGPVGTTGEILITGSISLPASLGRTGQHPGRYDHSDLDAIIEAVDRDDFEGDSAPVRAIRAVSTHTAPRDIIAATSKKSSDSRLPVVLAIIAGAMMVSVTVLVIAAFASNAF